MCDKRDTQKRWMKILKSCVKKLKFSTEKSKKKSISTHCCGTQQVLPIKKHENEACQLQLSALFLFSCTEHFVK